MENIIHQLPWALINKAAIGVVIVSDSGSIVLVNDFILKQTGFDAYELEGRNINFLIREEDASNTAGDGKPLNGNKYILRKNGTRFLADISTAPYTNNEGKFTATFINDTTSEDKAEHNPAKTNGVDTSTVVSLKNSLEKERELNELKSRFVSVASHEFRTPLSTILSSAFLMSKYTQGEDQPKRDRHIERIVSSVNLLTGMLNDFMSVGKIQEGKIVVKYEDMNIHEQTGFITSETGTSLKADQELKYYHTGKKIVRSDATLYRHILTNLISNAIKFSGEGSVIEVFTEGYEDSYVLRVKDYGMGISEEEQKHLFKRFFRGANVLNIQGAGLGLHIVAQYAELMNATVKCISTLGKGTEFIVSFKQNSENENDITH